MKLHSLSFQSQQIHDEIEEKFSGLPAGSEIALIDKYAPISVNVHIPEPDNMTSYRQKAFLKLREFSLDQRDIVIPLLPNAGTDSTKFKLTVPGNHPMYKPGKIETSYLFAFELAFAMTIHKAQGRTISSVVLALSSGPSKFQQMVLCCIFKG